MSSLFPWSRRSRFCPSARPEKEILLHLWSCVMHVVTDIHVRVLRVQIDFQRFIFDRDIGLLVFCSRRWQRQSPELQFARRPRCQRELGRRRQLMRGRAIDFSFRGMF